MHSVFQPGWTLCLSHLCPPEHAHSSGKARSEFESLTASVQRVLEGLKGGPAASLLEKDYALSDARALLPQSALMSAPFLYVTGLCRADSAPKQIWKIASQAAPKKMPKKLACAFRICSKGPYLSFLVPRQPRVPFHLHRRPGARLFFGQAL